MAARRLTWELLDPKGSRLAELKQRHPGAEVAIALNGKRTAQITLSLEDPAAELIRPFDRFLRVYLQNFLLFAGPIVVPRFDLSTAAGSAVAGEGVEVSAVDPSIRLAQSFTKDFARQTQIDQAEIMRRLMEHADRNATPPASQGLPPGDIPHHGIVRGGWTGPFTSILRDRSYPDGKQIWEALVEMSDVIGGPDFALTPVDAHGPGIWAQLDTHYPQQGTDKTAEDRKSVV